MDVAFLLNNIEVNVSPAHPQTIKSEGFAFSDKFEGVSLSHGMLENLATWKLEQN